MITRSAIRRPATLNQMPLAHVGHWIGQVLAIVPVLVVIAALASNWWRHRDDPRWYDREAEEAEQREIDEIVEG